MLFDIPPRRPQTRRHRRAFPVIKLLLFLGGAKDVDGRDKPGHDENRLPVYRRPISLDMLWMALIVDRNVGKITVGHQDRLHLPAPQHPGLEVDRDRCPADPHQVGMHGNQIADEHRFSEIHGFDRDRDGA